MEYKGKKLMTLFWYSSENICLQMKEMKKEGKKKKKSLVCEKNQALLDIPPSTLGQ